MGLIAQFKSSLGITLNGNDVENWANQGSGADVEQITAINQPEYVTGAHNGHNILRFTGSEYLECPLSGDLEIGTSDFTIAFVLLPILGDNMRIAGKGDPGGKTDQYQSYVIGSNPANYHGKLADGSNRRDHGSTTADLDGISVNVTVIKFNSTTDILTVFVDNVLRNDNQEDIGASMGDITASQKFQIGDVGSEGTIRLKGDLFEYQLHDSLEDESVLFNDLSTLYSNRLVSEISGGSGRPSFRLDFLRQSRYNRGLLRAKR